MFAASHGQARYNLPAYVLRATPGCHHRRLKPLQCTPNIDDLLGDIEAPDIAADIQSMQEKLGAVFEDGVAVSFGEDGDRRAAEAWQHGAVLLDRSHWGRLRLSGEGRKEFLQGQSAADINRLKTGQFCESAFCTPTGRTIDVATVLCQESGLLAVVSPGQQVALAERLDKHIFPMDKVEVSDITPETKMFTILGPTSQDMVAAWGAEEVTELEDGCHTIMAFDGSPVIVFKSSGLGASFPGWTVIIGEDAGAEFYRKAALQGVVPMGEEVWEHARVFRGVPACGKELTPDINALEAGLDRAISLEKGCFVGQETLAKVTNNNAVKQRLWRLRLRPGSTASPQDSVTNSAGAKVGFATSVGTVDDTNFALAYLKSKVEGERADWEGTQVTVGDSLAKVEMLPVLQECEGDGEVCESLIQQSTIRKPLVDAFCGLKFVGESPTSLHAGGWLAACQDALIIVRTVDYCCRLASEQLL